MLFYSYFFLLFYMEQFVGDFQIGSVSTRNSDSPVEIPVGDDCFNKFRILHNNIRSIDKNFNELNIVLSQFRFEVDCLVLSETFNINDTSLYNIEGYNLGYNEGIINQNDGVVLFIKDNIQYDFEIISTGEIRFVVLNIIKQNKKIQEIATYKPPSLNTKEFLDDLTMVLNACKIKR